MTQEVRFAFRALLRSPAFTIVTVTTLGVAIGGVTAIYSVVQGVLLQELPYKDPDRIVRVAATTRPGTFADGDASFSRRGYQFFAEQNHSFERFGAWYPGVSRVSLTGDGPPELVAVASMTATAFEILGVPPEHGRLPTGDDDRPGAPLVAVIGHNLWMDRYGSDPSVVGRMTTLDGTAVQIVGVMPASFAFPAADAEVWMPLQLDPASTNFESHFIEGLARLAPGATLASAEADARGLIARFGEIGYGRTWFTGVFDGGARVWTLREFMVGHVRSGLLVILGAMGFLLLIACSNAANLLLVRSESRSRAMSIRLALGARRSELLRLVFTESVILAVAGGLAGVLLAFLGVQTLVALGPSSIPRLQEVGIRAPILAFAGLVSTLAALLFGTLPALRIGSIRPVLAFGSSRTSIGGARNRMRQAILVAQVALALVLLVGSGLMIRTFVAMRGVDPGFDASRVLTFSINPVPTKYPDPAALTGFYDRVLQRAAVLPGVVAVGGIDALPLTSGSIRFRVVAEDFPPPVGEFPASHLIRRVTPGYFTSMGIPLVEGRFFTTDDYDLRPRSLVISQSLKLRYWPGSSALGKRMTVQDTAYQVVGVAGDVSNASLQAAPEPMVYTAMSEPLNGVLPQMTVTVRTTTDPLALVPTIRALLAEMDPDLPISDVRSMETVVRGSMSQTTFTMTLLVVGSFLALFLGCIGIYGVVSYITVQRTSEIGLRLCLGATPANVLRMVLVQGVRLAVVGIAIGLLVALALGKVMSSLLYGVGALDPITFVGGALVFLVVAALGCVVPAVRASRTSPSSALGAD